ncbi:MAG: SDR family oxidoreductase [Desulfobacterales bacterium]|jgi:3-oxoacyl-[acyl-carrier protein] reductase
MLNGKTALITGAGTGIGRATALRLAREGVNLTINYSRSETEARTTRKDCEALGVQSQLFQADVSNDEDVRQMVAKTIAEYGRLDFLVNCAGVTDFVDHQDLEGLKEAYWDRVMNVNVKGMFFCCRAAADEIRKREGCIINITSVAGLTGLGSSIAYAASKAAAISVTKSMARVMAPQARVNGIAPGIVQTRWVAGQEDHVKRLGEGTPMGRVATPEDVAEMAFSIIAHAGFVTGQNIVVDGGMFI